MNSGLRNWSDARVFLCVFREGSTLAASRKLGIAQPTVARRIDAIEKETGLTLFDRDTRGFRPSRAAHSLSPLAEAMEQAAGAFAIKSGELAKPRRIRITAPGTFSDKAMDIISEFVARNPGISFEFMHSVKVLDLLGGEANIALRISPNVPDESLICRTISLARWTLFGSQRYADRFSLPISEDDLHGHRFVTFQNEDVPGYLHDWLSSKVSPEQIVGSFSDLDLMHASIRAGRGLGLVNLRIAAADPALLRCFEPIEALSRANRMLVAPEAYRRPEVRKFTKFLAPRYAALFKDP